MILDQFSNKLRKGEWRTIAVEILIVVVAILLGLQVDDWNEGRKRDRERLVISNGWQKILRGTFDK
jgi:hypothetical protein